MQDLKLIELLNIFKIKYAPYFQKTFKKSQISFLSEYDKETDESHKLLLEINYAKTELPRDYTSIKNSFNNRRKGLTKMLTLDLNRDRPEDLTKQKEIYNYYRDSLRLYYIVNNLSFDFFTISYHNRFAKFRNRVKSKHIVAEVREDLETAKKTKLYTVGTMIYKLIESELEEVERLGLSLLPTKKLINRLQKNFLKLHRKAETTEEKTELIRIEQLILFKLDPLIVFAILEDPENKDPKEFLNKINLIA